MLSILRAPLVFLILSGLSSTAGAQDFAASLEAALTNWRLASWYARTENSGLAGVEHGEFRDRWSTIAERFGDVPSPPYDRDPAWRHVVGEVGVLADRASEQLDRDAADAASRTLEQIGDTLAASRARAGVRTFSDFVAAYRREMDRFGVAIAAGHLEDSHRDALRRAAEPLSRAVGALITSAQPEHRDAPEFQTIVRQNIDSVASLVARIDRPTRPTLELEVLGLWHVVRANYNLLFMRFG